MKPGKLLFLAAFLAFGLTGLAQISQQVKVIVDSANIRSRPEVDAEILDIAAKGALLAVIDKTGPWYTIELGKDQDGKSLYGYIHESMVDAVGIMAPALREVHRPEPAPPPPAMAQEPLSREKSISGSYIKYGFGEHWLLSFGADLGIGPYFGIGLEFQPYYGRYSEIDQSVLQLDIFVNAKLGFRLGFLTLYGGGGIGPDLSYSNTEINGDSLTELKSKLACHGILGLALNSGKIGLVFEFQPIIVSDPNLDPDTWGQFLFIGLRF